MRVIRIVPVLAILTATVLVASIFAFSVVGSVDATHLPEEELEAITLTVKRVDIVLTDDLAVKGEVIIIFEPTPPINFNFLGLQDGVLTGLGTLGTLDIPGGFVTQIRFFVTESSITFNGDTFLLTIPAGVLRLNGVLEVPDEDAVFDFDAEKSVIFTPAGFQLKSPIKFQTINVDG